MAIGRALELDPCTLVIESHLIFTFCIISFQQLDDGWKPAMRRLPASSGCDNGGNEYKKSKTSFREIQARAVWASEPQRVSLLVG